MTRRGGENSKMTTKTSFASVFFCFLLIPRKSIPKFCISNKISVILEQSLKSFLYIRTYTEVFRSLYRSF